MVFLPVIKRENLFLMLNLPFHLPVCMALFGGENAIRHLLAFLITRYYHIDRPVPESIVINLLIIQEQFRFEWNNFERDGKINC